MTFSAGDRLSHYVIEALIGEGGMGAVYRARDTKLERKVAIKILPEAFSRNAERMARFEREAKLLAALNHTNVATLYGLEDSDGRQLLVMELVEGETLAERIDRGPISLDEALRLFPQIAEGLEAAHEKGILHRDLKPTNVKIGPDGKVKILDFGLAKAIAAEGEAAGGASDSPTLTKDTALGTILGTAAYMSPEQARGHPLDKRTDVWAFGCCLFEALSGTSAFGGNTVSDTIASILKSEPKWDRLPETIPPLIRTLLKRCLEKDPHHRLHDVADARVLLDAAPQEAAPEPGRSPSRTPALVVVGAMLTAAIVGAVAVLSLATRDEAEGERRPTRFRIDTSRVQPVQPVPGLQSFALSPDGEFVVYAGGIGGPFRNESPLYVRRLTDWSISPIPGTEGSLAPTISPDGEWVAYISSAGKLMKAPIAGGRPTSLCAAQPPRGAHWAEDGWIYFQQYSKGIVRVREEGDEPEVVLAPAPEKGEKTTRHPFMLPGGRALLVTTGYATMGSYDEATIEAYELATGERKVLVEGGTSARYTESGHLLFARNGSLLAAPFDLDRLELLAQPETVVEGVLTSHSFGVAEVDVSRNGTLAYLPGTPELHHRKVYWAARDRTVEPFDTGGRNIVRVTFSPDGGRLAVHETSGNDAIWVYGIERGAWIRITNAWDNVAPNWARDGSVLVYGSIRPDGTYLALKNADGTGSEVLLNETTSSFSGTVSANGSAVIYPRDGGVWRYSLDAGEDPERIAAAHGTIGRLAVSPDGRWIAYPSNDSGRSEVYVGPFPTMDRQYPISTAGGRDPRWSGDGRQLFFLGEEGIFSVDVSSDEDFRASSPQLVLRLPSISDFDVDPQSDRIIVVQENVDELPKVIHVVLNWFEDLENLVPAE